MWGLSCAQGSSETPASAPSGADARSTDTATGVSQDALDTDLPDPPDPACADPACSEVVVAAGAFTMGCNAEADDQCDADEQPPHSVVLSAFAIDRTEVTVGAYRACVDAGVCSPPGDHWPACNGAVADRSDHPINCVGFGQARDYCAFVGKRLPTEAEWEKAARGTDRRVSPWGSHPPVCELVNFAGCEFSTAPVGSRPRGASPYGALDMAGSVLEWVSDFYDEAYYGVSPGVDPSGAASGFFRVARGGSYYGYPRYLRTSIRDPMDPPFEGDYIVGIRCARSLP